MRTSGRWKLALFAIAVAMIALLASLLLPALLGGQQQEDEAASSSGGEQVCGTGKLTVPARAMPWMQEAAKSSGLPIGYLAAIANQESGFDPTNFTDDSNGGTWGLFQLNREEWHKVYPQGDNPNGTPAGITDPMIHAKYAGIYLKNRLATVQAMQKAHPDAAYAKLPATDALVIAHNAGEGNLQRYPSIPSITQQYLVNVHANFSAETCSAPAAAPGDGGRTGQDDYSAFMRQHGFTPGDPSYVVDIYSFYYGECTGYAAFAVAHYSKYKDFTNNWRNGSHFGYAYQWADGARRAGIAVDGTPAVGAVAQSMTDGAVGHVAYVTAVHSDGTFDINEANFQRKHYFGSRTNLKPGGEFQNFLHFEK